MNSPRKDFITGLVRGMNLVPEEATLKGDTFSWTYEEPQGFVHRLNMGMFVFNDKLRSGQSALRIKFTRKPNISFETLQERAQKLVPEGVEVTVRNSISPYVELVIELKYSEKPW